MPWPLFLFSSPIPDTFLTRVTCCMGNTMGRVRSIAPATEIVQMASFDFDPALGNYHIRFRHGGKPFKRSLQVADNREAERVCGVVEETIKDLKRGRLKMPGDADPGAYLISGGKLTGKPKLSNTAAEVENLPFTLGRVFDTYAVTLTSGSKEANTLETEAVHSRHFKRLLGESLPFERMGVETLQSYVNTRSKEDVSRDTIRKELATLRAIWGWAHKRRHIASPVNWKMADLTDPKAKEKAPIQTWEPIDRKIARGGLTDEQKADLWDSLWLNQEQTVECLGWVRENGAHPFIYPMFAFAAYTGARRGEMLRSERDDWDWDAGVVSIRQKKADNSMSFTRRSVPIHPDLSRIMTEWFEANAGCPWAISTAIGKPIGPRMSTKYFRATVAGGKWAVLHGWHVFRHSLASNRAVAGVDHTASAYR